MPIEKVEQDNRRGDVSIVTEKRTVRPERKSLPSEGVDKRLRRDIRRAAVKLFTFDDGNTIADLHELVAQLPVTQVVTEEIEVEVEVETPRPQKQDRRSKALRKRDREAANEAAKAESPEPEPEPETGAELSASGEAEPEQG